MDGLQLYLWIKFPQNKPKLWKFTRNLLGRQVPSIILWKFPQIIRFCGNLSGISTSFHELKFSSELLQPFLLGIFPQNSLLCWNLFLIFQEKTIKIFHNVSRVDLFHKIVVANHAMLRKFQTPSKSVWGRISTFLMSDLT